MRDIVGLFTDGPALLKRRVTHADVPWADLGIARRYTIFFTGRNGSTWLTEMLAQTGLCGKPEELLNEEIIEDHCRRGGVSDARSYLKDVVNKYKGPDIFGLEIDPLRYVNASKIIDVETFFFHNDCNSIWLTRNDVLSQAYSFAAAKRTGHWHLRPGQPDEVDNHDIKIDDRDIWWEIFFVLESERFMNSEFTRTGTLPVRISYEDLVTDKFSVLATILVRLGFAANEVSKCLAGVVDNTRKLAHSGKHSVLADFMERNWTVYSRLLESRASPNLTDLRRLLAEYRGVTLNVPPAFAHSLAAAANVADQTDASST